MPCGHGGFSFYVVWAASGGRRGGEVFALPLPGKERQGLSFERWLLCPAGTEAFLFLLFGPPPAGADGGLLGASLLMGGSIQLPQNLSCWQRIEGSAVSQAGSGWCRGRRYKKIETNK